MNKSNSKASKIHIFKKFFQYTSFASLAVAPVAVVVSCGSDDTAEPQTYRAKVSSSFSQREYFKPESISSSVQPYPIPLDPIAKSYQYLYGNFSTLEAVKKAPLSEWKIALPTVVDFVKKTRYLWVKITPKTLAELGQQTKITQADLDTFVGDSQYLDITFSSKIQDIKSDIGQQPGFSSFSLEGVKINGTLDAPTLQYPTAPIGSEIIFIINNTYVKSQNLVAYIQANRLTMTAAILANTTVSLNVVDAKQYVLNDSKTAQVTSTIKFADNLDTLINALKLVTFDSKSNNTTITWTNLPGVVSSTPSSIEKVEYYLGTEATEEQVINNKAIVWGSTPPSTAVPDHTTRHLWAKFTPVSSIILSSYYLDITSTSNVQKIRTLIIPPITNLATMSLGGDILNPVVENIVTAPQHAKVQIKVGTLWVDTDEVVNFIKSNPDTIRYQDLSNPSARYAVEDPTLYVLSNAYETPIPNNMAVSYQIPTNLITSLNALRPTTTSNSQAVAWQNVSGVAAAKPSEITEVRYYSGPKATAQEVAADSTITWSTDLPTQVDSVHEQRHLYAKVFPAGTLIIANPIIDLTQASLIRDIKTMVNIPVTLNLGAISFVSKPSVTMNLNGIAAPANTLIKYSFNNDTTWRTQEGLIAYVSALTPTPTLAAYQNVKAHIEPISDRYVIDNDREALIVYVGDSYRDRLATTLRAFTFFDTTSISTDVKWTLPSRDTIAKSYKYLLGDYATTDAVKAAPATSWVDTLPQIISFDKQARQLWVKVETYTLAELGTQTAISAADIDSFSGDSQYILLTAGSKVQSIRSDVAQQDSFTTLSLSGFSVSGSLDTPVLNKPTLTLPIGSELRYEINNTTQTETGFTDYLKANRATLTNAILGASKVKLVASNTSLYTLSQSKEALIEFTLGSTYRPTLVTTLSSTKYFGDASISSAVTSETITLDPIAKEYKYLYGNYDSLVAAKAANATEWKATLPTLIDFDKTVRHLWVRVIPRALNELTQPTTIITTDIESLNGDNAYFDVTTWSSIGSIPSDVAQLASFASLSLSGFSVTGSLDTPVLNKPTLTLPTGSELRYEISGSTFTDTAFIDYLKSNKLTITTATLNAAKVKLVAANSGFALSQTKEALITITLTNTYRTTLQTALNTDAYFNATSISSAVNPKTVSLDPIAKQYKYLSGNYSTLALAKAVSAAEWKDALPTIVTFDKSTRYLWIQVITNSVSELTLPTTVKATDIEAISGDDAYFNVTTGSKIQDIRSDVAQQAAFTSLSLSGFSLTGDLDNPVLNKPALTLPDGSELRYEISGSDFTETAFTDYIKNNKATLTSATLSTAKVKLVVSSATLFALSAAKEAAITITLTNTYRNALETSLRAMTYFQADSYSTLMKPETIMLDPIAKQYEYLSGNYDSLTAAKAAPTTAWSLSLPSVVTFDKTTRYLWVRVTPQTAAKLVSPTTIKAIDLESLSGDNAYFNVTTGSGIQGFKSDVAQQAGFAAINLDVVRVNGTVAAPAVALNGVTIPTGAKLQFEFNGTTYASQAAFITAITNNSSFAESTFADTYVSFDVESTSSYFLASTNTKRAKIDATSTFLKSLWDAKFPTLSTKIVNNQVIDDAFVSTSLPSNFYLPKAVTTIGARAFKAATIPAGFKLPALVTTIGEGAFANTTLPTGFTIPSGVTSLAATIFNGATIPIGFTIPSTVTSLGNQAFDTAGLPTGFTLPTSISQIGEGAFASTTIPSGFTIPSLVTSLANNLFKSAVLPTGFTLPSTVTTIGNAAFQSATLPASFRLPTAVTTLGTSAFASTTLPTGFTIPSTVTRIEASLFTYATLPAGFTLPSSITAIGANGFDHAVLPAGFTIPSAVTTIGVSAFESVIIPSGFQLPSTLPTIGESVFARATLPTGFIIPFSVKTIGKSSFNGATVQPGFTLPAGVTSIGDTSFANMTLPVGFTLPLTLRAIGLTAFGSTTLPTNFALNEGLVALGAGAFEGNIMPTGFTLPTTLRTIGGAAFRGATLQAGFVIPNGVTSIGASAFNAAVVNAEFNLPTSISSIGNSAFYGVTFPAAFRIPAGYTVINDSSFNGAILPDNLTLSPATTSIGALAFQLARIPYSFVIPASVATIGNGAFKSARLPVPFTIPATVTSLGTDVLTDSTRY